MVSRIVLWFLAMLVPTGVYADTSYIKLQLDGDEIFKGDTIALDVESTGLLDPIDFGVIEQQATLIRETTGSRIAVIGGKVQSVALRRMVIVPQRTGVVVIGPLTAGDVVSNSVHLKVLDAVRPEWTPSDDDAQINITLNPEDVMVNQQALLTVELLHRYPIYSESINLPDLTGFSKRPLIENRRTLAGDNNEWFRTEWQTLVYPRQSGNISIDAINWSGTLAKSNVERSSFTRSTKPITLKVSSAPVESSGWWLPAGSVSLSDTWSSPPIDLSAGDEIERTITLRATNVLAGQLPTPELLPSRALKQVLISTERTESIQDKSIRSSADFTYRVTAQSPIPVFLDTVRVEWWDTTGQSLREAIIPARRINVGLPDRADILSKIALEQTGIGQLEHRLQSFSLMRIFSYVVAAVAVCCLLWWYTPVITQTIRCRISYHRQVQTLRNIARSGDALELYRELQSSRSMMLYDADRKQLIEKLELALFNRQPYAEQSDGARLLEWLKPVTGRTSHRKQKGSQAHLVPQLAEL